MAMSIFLFFGSCAQTNGRLGNVAASAMSRDRYAKELQRGPLKSSALTRQWLAAGSNGLKSPMPVPVLPSRMESYWKGEQPQAIALKMSAKRGQRLQLRGTIPADSPMVFVEIFQAGESDTSSQNASSELRQWAEGQMVAGKDITYDIEEDGQFIVRVQPELLAQGRYTLELTLGPQLAVFPIQGKGNRAIQSFWGQERDGGTREHHGIDIFAARGTPLLASTDGTIVSTGDYGRGGKHLWMNSANNQIRLYYAHLDEFHPHSLLLTAQVKAGDTIGYVGSTGNAKGGPPHLHFGIYTMFGPVDPLKYVWREATNAAPTAVASEVIGRLRTVKPTWAKASDKNGALSLPMHAPMVVIGALSGGKVLGELPNGERVVMALADTKPRVDLGKRRLPLAMPMLARLNDASSLIDTLEAGFEVTVLGVFQEQRLVQIKHPKPSYAGEMLEGWVALGPPEVKAAKPAARRPNGV